MNRSEKRRQKRLLEKSAKKDALQKSEGRHSTPQQPLTIQQAIDIAAQHHALGQLPEAARIYQKIIQINPKQPFALHMLGVIAHQMGKGEVAVDLITKALAIDPNDATAHNSLGLALRGLGKSEEAVASYHRSLAINPDDANTHYNLGIALQDLEQLEDAVASYHRAIALKPDDPSMHNNLGNALQGLERLEEAVASFQTATSLKPDHAEAHYNLGNALQSLGRLDEAVASYTTALGIRPDYENAHCNLGNALRRLERLEEAVASFHKAIAIEPDDASTHYNLGQALQSMGKLEEAIASYRRAIALNPDEASTHDKLGQALHDLERPDEAVASFQNAIAIKPDLAEAHFNLAEALEKTNRTEAFREVIGRAKQNFSGDARLSLIDAKLLKMDGDCAAARAVLEPAGESVSNPRFLAARAYLLGDLCDRLGDVDAAFKYFTEANRRRHDTLLAKQWDGQRVLSQIDVLKQRFTADWIADWRHVESSDGRPDPVFLVGFPRSGTTLLDNILRSHAAITVIEERPTVVRVQKRLEQVRGGYPDNLAELEPAHLAELRQIYFGQVDKYLDAENRSPIVIDKLPLNTMSAGLIHRVFPQARFLFAQRHPCDCVLSCFMQDFVLNDAMATFLNLEDTAQLYDSVMTLWRRYQDVLTLPVHTVCYETLVESFDETLAPVLDFLGLDWDEGVRNYAETARRGNVHTPSYNQVTQPLYTRARGRWERYLRHMRPVLPVLLPWAEQFGYGESIGTST